MKLRRVVVTGYGIVSSIGNNSNEVLNALIEGRSGITFSEEFASKGFRSQVWGMPTLRPEDIEVSQKLRRFLSQGTAWNYAAMKEAIAMAKLSPALVSHDRTGIIMGSGGPSTADIVEAADITRERKSPKKIGVFVVPKTMSSTAAATLAIQDAFGIRGINISVSSACASSPHCIGLAIHQIAFGLQDRIFAGGSESLHWTSANCFDSMPALAAKFNDTPKIASRPYDSDRCGFVIAGGAGVVVLEDLESALARGATIIAEIIGFGYSSDGGDMTVPSGEGAVRCMKMALAGIDGNGVPPIEYINTHGTSTPVGDVVEVNAMREVFGEGLPPFSSTKALTGHSLGAVGAQEAIYCMMMMQANVMVASANIFTLDPALGDAPVLRENRAGDFDTALSNSFGFGGTNATLILQRYP